MTKKLSRFLPLLVVSALLLNILVCFSWFTQGVRAQAPSQVYIQTDSGLVVKGQPVDPFYRSDDVVLRFAQEFVSVAYTWPMNGEGHREGKVIYPLPMYTQAFKIHPDIRAEWLGRQHIAYAKAKDPFTNYVGKSHHTKTTLTGAKIERIDPEAHEWDIRLYATQYRFDGQNNLIYNPVKINKILTLRAVQGFRPNWQIADTELGRMIDDALHAELLITNIVDLPT
ncbi:hypothetical protein HRE53_32175 (plasmid) [Acaryochloris sp. 'Moss Beach']|uniref:hypothetical protein n=1 Tax=Acaryochloris sp. 'Moss Beach' TaxID=2740837 RepID=UPI001F308644|nr:hypothetical protein [Acaryochloris sp. 'Moss Beach']UJB73313.1 hypothetical protein HRE53_32175 [Acaryochloris sp. 'Moss Beach']